MDCGNTNCIHYKDTSTQNCENSGDNYVESCRCFKMQTTNCPDCIYWTSDICRRCVDQNRYREPNPHDGVIGGLLAIATRLSLTKCLTELGEVCENQQTISTRKLQHIADRISDRLKEESQFIAIQAERLRRK